MVRRLNAQTRVSIIAVVLLAIACLPVAGKTVYVNCTRPDDTGDGLTWASAKKTVQAGIDTALSGDQVWVAKGLYVTCITLKDGVALYGGFAGGESQLSQRAPFLRAAPDPNETVLDGDQGGSVVTMGSNTTVDGFTIRNGGGYSPVMSGGGVCATGSRAATVSNNTIMHNLACFGGGVCLSDGDVIRNIITDNVAVVDGGGVCCLDPSGEGVRIAGNVIARNRSQLGSAGVLLQGPSLVVNNTIVGNTLWYGGGEGGLCTVPSWDAMTVSNNVIAFNESGLVAYNGAVTLLGNCVYGNVPCDYAGTVPGISDISADPVFEDLASGNYHLTRGSPCIEAGDNSQAGSAMDADGFPRIQGARVDTGAYEFPAEGATGVPYAQLQVPGAVRPGREYTARIHYGNSGSADLPLPLLNLTNSSGVPLRIGQEGRESDEGLALLGVPPPGSTTLPPGFEGTIPITFIAPASGTVQFDLKALQDREALVDWGAYEPILRPEGVAADDSGWLSFWAVSTQQLGSTWRQVLDKTAALAGGTSAPSVSLFDFTGVLGFALTLGENLGTAANQCNPATYDAQSDVNVYEVDQPFNCNATRTYVVTHGWNASSADADIASLSHAIKDHCQSANVIQVDWHGGAGATLPWCAASHTLAAAIEADNKIKAKIEQRCPGQSSSFDWSNVTYVGHSFGNSVNSRIASFHGRQGKAVILHPANPLGGSDPNFSDDFAGGSVSVSTGGLADANPCMSPRIAGTNLKLTDYASDLSDPLAHGTALRCLAEQLDNAGGSCDNQVLTNVWPASTQNPGWYDGTLSCDGDVDYDPGRPPCAESILPPGVTIALALARVVMPIDPNEKTGPIGEGPDKLVCALDDLEYTIYFENAPEATAPVQEAIITDDLSGHLDWTTFQLQEIAFGDKIVPIDGGSSYSGSVDIPDLRVDLIAVIDGLTGRAQWILRAIDPATGLPPIDAMAGFLPPNDPATHSGEGHVRFKIRPKADTPVGTVISNIASIVFDGLPEVATPAVSNTVGAFPPGEVSNPSPADGATHVAINTALSWSPANRTTSYGLYVWCDGLPKPTVPTVADWPATGYQPMADLALATMYHWQVVARNSSGETPGPEWTFTTAPLPPVTYARSLGNGQLAGISRAVVSAAFPDFLYLEADDRSSGIRVERPAHGLSVGMRAEVTGTVNTNLDGERYIEADWATKSGTGWVDPLGMNRKLLGGADFLFNEPTGAGQRGVLDGFGLNNIGLLVKLWGRVAEVEEASPPTWFTLDDGCGPPVKCAIPSDVTISPVWQLISVTGISSCERVGEELHRLLLVRSQDDIAGLQ